MSKEQELVARRARNLNIISVGIIVYLLAGADIGHISALGLRAPVQYPAILQITAVLGLGWFYWRYSVAWGASDCGIEFKKSYTDSFLIWAGTHKMVRVHLDWQAILDFTYSTKKYESFSRNVPDGLDAKEFASTSTFQLRLLSRRSFALSNLSYETERARHSVVKMTLDGRNDALPNFETTIPRYHYEPVRLFHSVVFALSGDAFAEQRLPHYIGRAAALMLLSSALWDPAGLWGLLRS